MWAIDVLIAHTKLKVTEIKVFAQLAFLFGIKRWVLWYNAVSGEGIIVPNASPMPLCKLGKGSIRFLRFVKGPIT